MNNYSFDGVIFDLDGVITHTASVHSKAWKQMFDAFLKIQSENSGEPYREFSHAHDYLPYVDGKPRYQGVASFLESRGFDLPYGDPSDPPNWDTICGLGNRKDLIFNKMLKQGKVKIFHSTVNLIKELKEADIKVGVASSSKNAKTVLDAAGLTHLFETRVDGVVSAQLKLMGKPEPDIFTTASRNLGVSVDRTVIVEDAVSGVQAGANGNFGLILGVARQDNELELLLNGADIVVEDLGDIDLHRLENWFTVGIEESKWTLQFHDYTQEDEGTREVLCAVGNGYFGSRGSMEETKANGVNYPGTYIAGVYNRLESTISGRTIVNEDFVNSPNWSFITFRFEDGDWFDPNEAEILKFSRRLDFRSGVLWRRIHVRDRDGRETIIESNRLASMANPHLAAIQYTIKPLNYSGKITIRSGIDGNIINAGVERYRQLNSKHLVPMVEGERGDCSYLVVRTNQSHIQIAEAAKHILYVNDQPVNPDVALETMPGAVYSTFHIISGEKTTIRLEKIVSIYTSKDQDTTNNLQNDAIKVLENINHYADVQRDSAAAWYEIWKKIDIQIEGDRMAQKLLRLNQYHTLTTASPHNKHIDAGIPARGLHGEAYRGHIFWDELYILPLYFLHFPEVAKSVLIYRYRRLNRAREYARAHGYKGAMYPWQSGSDGREETQVIHLNPLSGEWGPDHSSLQRHISLAIAYNIWHYTWISEDWDFLKNYGGEMFLEICRFWADKAHLNPQTGRYEIDKVMGPDEFHEKYPSASEGGLKNNSYTNVMVVWTLNKAFEFLAGMGDESANDLRNKINLQKEELDTWKQIINKIYIPLSEDYILEQFEGYFELEELDWDYYRNKYTHISRMDRILKSEGKSPDRFKVAKQADTLMLFYNLDVQEVRSILKRAGYPTPEDLLERNYQYYYPRTSHGSTLSKLVHAYLANIMGETDLSLDLFREALKSDYLDVQRGTTKEGIHVGVMAGTAVLAIKAYTGLDLNGEILRINPCLPNDWRRMKYNISFKGDRYAIEVNRDSVSLKVETDKDKTNQVLVNQQHINLTPQKWVATNIGDTISN